MISFSLSYNNFSKALCTLPADKPFTLVSIFAHKHGDNLYPINRSITDLAFCAFTSSILSLVGFLRASKIAFLVISRNIILLLSLKFTLRISPQCHAIASPSLSSSAAKLTFLFLDDDLRFLITSSLPLIVINGGLKSLLISISVFAHLVSSVLI